MPLLVFSPTTAEQHVGFLTTLQSLMAVRSAVVGETQQGL
jgi:hypothetical protein